MTTYPRRLIEVDLPIKRISAHARREKSIRHGHISTLHIWWARRPLASCRAVICASLWPDPADELCPQAFRDKAADIILKFAWNITETQSGRNSCHEYSLGRWDTLRKLEGHYDTSSDAGLTALRTSLLHFIADFANWDNSTRKEYLETARALTQSAHEALGGAPGTRPLVVDPFAGGGAIPLEALRVGADAFASDLNPVAVLLNKVVLEYIPRYGQQLADEVRKWGGWVKEQAERELSPFYPADDDGATPIAYLWARTVTCEGPGCGAEVPLMRSLWLARKSNRSVALRMIPDAENKRVDFEIIADVKASDVGNGTVNRGNASCPVCQYTTPVASVRRQLSERQGGAADARLFAVVTTRPGHQGRFYRLPTPQDLKAAAEATAELERRKAEHEGPLSLVPDEPTPQGGGSGAGRAFSQRNYGMDTFGDLFTPRQALALTTLVRLVNEAGDQLRAETDSGLADAVQVCLALAADRQADYLSSLVVWANSGEFIAHTFGRQALPIVWEWPECNLWQQGSGNWMGAVGWIANVIGTNIVNESHTGQVQTLSATNHILPDAAVEAFFTDPPYYDAVPYADLSDFFYVWLRRSLPLTAAGDFSLPLAPKQDECIVDEVKSKDNAYFEQTMAQAMTEGRRVLAPDGIGLVVFAHKTTSGWEALLQAMVDAGWMITGSWPVDTERPGRLRAQNSAALASSIHLVCRPRENPDGSLRTNDIGDWRDVLQELPGRIHEWMPRLAREGIVGADAIFACIGPALEIFSRYSAVEKPSGERVTLREYLEEVWAAVAREGLNMVFQGADATGFEEDARLTSMWLWTMSTGDESNGTGGNGASASFTLEYDTARKIAQGLGAHLERLESVVNVRGDKATLLSVSDRSRHLMEAADAASSATRRRRRSSQLALEGMNDESDGDEDGGPNAVNVRGIGSTVLDRVHQAMLLFASGRGTALRRFLVDDGVGRDERFWRLAQALSALYPSNTEEKRWVDGVLARKRGLGF